MPDYVTYNLKGYIVDKFISVDPSVVEGRTNLLEITRDEINSLTKFHIVKDGVLRLMVSSEKDTLIAEETQAIIDQENARIMNLDALVEHIDLSGLTLTKVDIAINNIGNLNDAKAFLKKLCRYIIKFIAR